MKDAIKRFKRISSEERFKGWPLVGTPKEGVTIPFFGKTIEYELRTGNGVEQYVSFIRTFGWVVCFGVTVDNEVVTLVQWKPGVNQASWELSPGGIGKLAPGTSLEEITKTSQEVFLKETGYGGGTWHHLGKGMVETAKYRGAGPDDHGLPAHMYLATGLTKIQDARQPNRNEIIETLMVPLAEFYDVIDSGLFNEVSALTCALLALRKLSR